MVCPLLFSTPFTHPGAGLNDANLNILEKAIESAERAIIGGDELLGKKFRALAKLSKQASKAGFDPKSMVTEVAAKIVLEKSGLFQVQTTDNGLTIGVESLQTKTSNIAGLGGKGIGLIAIDNNGQVVVFEVKAAIDGGSRLVYVTLPTDSSLEDPDAYIFPVGLIEQASVPDGVLNITTVDHGVYKGTIRSTIFEHEGNIFIHTHGVGINRAFNGRRSFLTQPAFEFAASTNDRAGMLAFRALDQTIYNNLQTQRINK